MRGDNGEASSKRPAGASRSSPAAAQEGPHLPVTPRAHPRGGVPAVDPDAHAPDQALLGGKQGEARQDCPAVEPVHDDEIVAGAVEEPVPPRTKWW